MNYYLLNSFFFIIALFVNFLNLFFVKTCLVQSGLPPNCDKSVTNLPKNALKKHLLQSSKCFILFSLQNLVSNHWYPGYEFQHSITQLNLFPLFKPLPQHLIPIPNNQSSYANKIIPFHSSTSPTFPLLL